MGSITNQPYDYETFIKEELFREGLWTIRALCKEGKNAIPTGSVITHLCRFAHTFDQIDFLVENNKCINCGQKPPNSIIAIWKLHNWDKT